jgi:hypothetical protein
VRFAVGWIGTVGKWKRRRSQNTGEVETVVSKNCGMGLTDAAFPISYSQSEK